MKKKLASKAVKKMKKKGGSAGKKYRGEQGGDFVQHWHRVALPCGRWGRTISKILPESHTTRPLVRPAKVRS